MCDESRLPHRYVYAGPRHRGARPCALANEGSGATGGSWPEGPGVGKARTLPLGPEETLRGEHATDKESTCTGLTTRKQRKETKIRGSQVRKGSPGSVRTTNNPYPTEQALI